MTNNESKGPFEGLLVIDMTHVLNGPFGTQLLCNMGARVIKVEPPGHGDDTRTFGPYVDGQSLYYSFINHGKGGYCFYLTYGFGLVCETAVYSERRWVMIKGGGYSG